ncbi:hypothetical protein [Roseinatronobacter alkalisoli]|uniref:DUF4760 domain-containing protein n=1 Tax=Roseinatronobacter alkalisoli TaxID=3028235 RepID=A0ABT5TBL6_9RHOB|nr:hypothetical protein [Roseinatronobacter sp. HJB301]MDD7971313.1 hypothetical protein [Roseinatronobacter sp. HJB301]
MAWSTVIQTFSAMVAAISVLFGVTSWRRTELGKRRVDLAEETVEIFGKLRDAFQHIRSPFSFSGEGSSRERNEGETPEESEILDRANIVFERYRKYENTFNRAYALKFRAKAYFGKDVGNCFDEMFIIRAEIFSAAQSLARSWRDQGRRKMNQGQLAQHIERMHKNEEIFWETGGEDEIKKRINNSVQRIEDVCTGIIQPRPTLKVHAKSICCAIARYIGLASYE